MTVTTPQRTADLLYDSEAALRLVDAEVARLRQDEGRDRQAPPTPPAAVAPTIPPGALATASHELRAVLEVLRESRGALEQATVGRLETTQVKLQEVNTAAETAVSDILDGLDRAQALIDALDAPDATAEQGAALRAQLRDELFVAATHLQFQDIASQQLLHVTRTLGEMEQRLADIARMIDPAGPALRRSMSLLVIDENAYDPNATVSAAADRQALADAVFGRGSAPR